jgi:hypothetical protein
LIGCNPAKNGESGQGGSGKWSLVEKKKVKNREKVVKLAKQREI